MIQQTQQYGQYVGLDVHKKMIQATVLNGIGEKMLEKRFENNKRELQSFTEYISSKAKIVMESCSIWQHIYDFLESKGFDVQLAHPLKTRAIAEARIKTDKVDSEILAQLLRTNFIPNSYVPTKEMRELREFVRHRATLSKTRTIIKNRVHAILARNGISHEFSDLFGKEGIAFLKQLELKEKERIAMDNLLTIIETINNKIDEVESDLFEIIADNKQAELFATIPGIGIYSALLAISEIGDINRFSSHKKLCSYAGLVPSVYQSGNTIRRGKITKQGSKWLRWTMVRAAHHAVKQDSHLQKFYFRIANKKGKKPAIVACARKLLVMGYYMLRENKTYKEIQSHYDAQVEGDSALFHGLNPIK